MDLNQMLKARGLTKSVHIPQIVSKHNWSWNHEHRCKYFSVFLKNIYESYKYFQITAVFLRGLDALSTEDSVLNCLMHLTQLPIKSIRIGRDPLTQTSRGVCYVEMNSVVDAMFLHNQLLGEPPTIDDKLVSIRFIQYNFNIQYNSFGSLVVSNLSNSNI